MKKYLQKDKGSTMTELVTLREKVLLFAEDDDIVRDKTMEILGVLFKKVITAKDGQEALEKYTDNAPDIIFTDIKMPNLDGLEFASEVRKNDLHTPIVFFSSHSEQKYLLRAVNLDVNGYITKPTSLEELLKVFAKCAKKMNVDKPQSIHFNNNIVYQVHTNEVIKNGQKLPLGAKEHALLGLLIQKYPNILTKEEASQKVWAMEEITDSAIKNVIARLRSKLGQESIVAVSGVGWRIEL